MGPSSLFQWISKKEFKDHHKCIADVELILPKVPYYMEIFWHLKANLQTTQFKCN